MKINTFLVRFAISIIIIFGGVFLLRFIQTGDLLLDQLIALIIGVILLISSIIWRKKYKLG